MGRLIDCNDVYNAIQITTDNFGVLKGVVESNMLTMLSKIETVEAIPKADYENRLKADMEAMLTELQLEIEEHEESIIGHYGKETKESDFPSHKIERNNGRKECVGLIQQKIDKLKEQST